jgi:cation transport ATPase
MLVAVVGEQTSAAPREAWRSKASGDFSRFLSLVIVDYGTGIRVAAPTAVLASMTHAARAGIIIKSGAHMERLAEVYDRRRD